MDYLFIILVLIIAILYASVGHGGASGYLALMALFSMNPDFMKPSALLLNVFVSSISFYAFYRNGYFKLKLLWPFIVTSIPFAFLGGLLTVEPSIYKIILGIFLLFAVSRMLFAKKIIKGITRELIIGYALIIGAVIGFLSGLIGIGGGIILSPIILLFGWGNVKETAAVSAVFILVNSISGLSGLYLHGLNFRPDILYMAIAGVLGGLIGARLGSKYISEQILRYLLSFVLFFAAIKLILL